MRKRVVKRKQAISQVDIFVSDLFRRFSVKPRHTRIRLRAVYAANRRKCAVLNPADIHIPCDLARVAAEVGAEIRQTHFAAAVDHVENLLLKALGGGSDVACPLERIAVSGKLRGIAQRSVVDSVNVRHEQCAACVLTPLSLAAVKIFGN